MARGWLKGLGIAAACVGVLPAVGGLLHAATRTAPCDRTELTASIGDRAAVSAACLRSRSPHHRARRRYRLQPDRRQGRAGRRPQGQEAHELLRHARRDLQRGRRRSCLRQSRDRRHRPERPPAGRQGQGRVPFPEPPGRAESADRCRLQSVLARQQSFLRLRAARRRGDALSCRRGQRREGHRLCRHRQQFRRGDPPRLHRPRRHAHRLLGDRHHDRRSAAISRRSEQARPGLLSRSPRLRGDGGQAHRHAGRLPHPLDPLRARRPRRARRAAARRLAQLRRRSRRVSISSSATIRMWSKASSSTASR